jgi:phosphoglycolate phosphatase
MNKQNGFKQHFVFDLDDTLVDGRQFCGETIARSFEKIIPDVNKELVIAIHEIIRGKAIPDLYKEIAKELKLDLDVEKNLEELLRVDAKIQISEIHRLALFDGVIDIFEFLKSKGKKIHICTNRPTNSLIPALKHNKILNYFDNIISCLDEGYKKPDPKCLVDIIKSNGNKREDFIYFGDSEVDSQFAKNSGIDFIIFDQYLNEKNLFKKLINLFLEEKINNNRK